MLLWSGGSLSAVSPNLIESGVPGIAEYVSRNIFTRCRKINLGYLDPQTIRIAEWGNREKEGILVVPKSGETLYRLK